MIYLDLALRGGGVTVLLLLAALLWRAPIGREGRLSITAVAITQSAFLILKAALPIELNPIVEANLIFLTSLTPAAITWLIVTIFLDAPGRRGPWMVASLATSAAFYWHLVDPSYVAICLPMSLALYGALFVLSLWSTRDDLVECRCRARPGFAAAIAGLALFLTGGRERRKLGSIPLWPVIKTLLIRRSPRGSKPPWLLRFGGKKGLPSACSQLSSPCRSIACVGRSTRALAIATSQVS